MFSRLFSGWQILASLATAIGLAIGPTHTAQAQLPASGEKSHCLLLPLDPDYRAQQAALVVEGQVLAGQSFWDDTHQHLFTRHRLRVLSVFKGSLPDTAALTLITEGGRLGLHQQLLTNTLRLTAGQQGVFFLRPATWHGLPATGGPAWAVFGSQQGFIAYDVANGTAAEPFQTYPAINAAFYAGISRRTGQARQIISPSLSDSGPGTVASRTLAPVITQLVPRRLAAGIDAVLTIEGSDFGDTREKGFVQFKNANDGGATWVQPRDADYVSWTSTRIQVRVPSSGSNGNPAGTGTVRVTTSSGLPTESAVVLTIAYAVTNVESATGNLIQRPNHINQNGSGGLTFQFGPSLAANPAAGAAWQRALATWRCQTGINWALGPAATTAVVADDGQNVVVFDSGGELPAQVLGRTTSYYEGCYTPNGDVVFWVDEVDMQFDDAARFQFGPLPATFAQVDFETVVVHELGHAQQLTHLISLGAVMHYTIAFGQNTRQLSATNDVVAGRKVLRDRSFIQFGCGKPAMLPAPLSSQTTTAMSNEVTLAWTTRNECFLSNFVVERSLSGDTTAWEPLTTVGASAATSYSYTDRQPRPGLHYYRLRLRRPDNSLDNAAPLPVNTTEAAGVSVFPNPVVGNQLRLQYPAAAAGAITFRIYDELGRLLRTSSGGSQPGLNIFTLEVANLQPGFYVLRWYDAQGQQGTEKFVRL